jgi:hypothetical protein
VLGTGHCSVGSVGPGLAHRLLTATLRGKDCYYPSNLEDGDIEIEVVEAGFELRHHDAKAFANYAMGRIHQANGCKSSGNGRAGAPLYEPWGQLVPMTPWAQGCCIGASPPSPPVA